MKSREEGKSTVTRRFPHAREVGSAREGPGAQLWIALGLPTCTRVPQRNSRQPMHDDGTGGDQAGLAEPWP